MRVLVVSDIHANLAAFEAVLRAAGTFDQLWCLGDTVGYGAEPNECVARLRALPHRTVAGNHDLAAVGRIGLEWFNPDAARALEWTVRQLDPVARDFLRDLPITLVEGEFTFAHGSPRDPVWEYLLSPLIARASFAAFETRFCLVGHTHIPARFSQSPDGEVDGEYLPDGTVFDLATPGRHILNPGGVGQPRDDDPRTAYVLLDLAAGRATWHRVEYPIEATQAKMRAARLPARLLERLSAGW